MEMKSVNKWNLSQETSKTYVFKNSNLILNMKKLVTAFAQANNLGSILSARQEKKNT